MQSFLFDDYMAFKIALFVIAGWRIWRVMALDTGPWQIFRFIRQFLDVRYRRNDQNRTDYSKWHTNDGSFAEGMTCINCAPFWVCEFLLLPALIFLPSWLFIDLTLPFAGSALIMFLQRLYVKIGGD